jgi:hypothetical protein
VVGYDFCDRPFRVLGGDRLLFWDITEAIARVMIEICRAIAIKEYLHGDRRFLWSKLFWNSDHFCCDCLSDLLLFRDITEAIAVLFQ